MIRRLNLDMPDEAAFADLAQRGRPLGMRAGRPTFQLLRETYFDTADGTLRSQGMTLCLRKEAGGREMLELSHVEEVSLQGIAQEETCRLAIQDGGLYAALSTDAELSTKVRALVDPHALRPWVALDIDREARELKPGVFGRPTHRILLDEVIAQVPRESRAFQVVTITEIGRGAVSLEALGGRLVDEYQVSADGRGTYERVRDALLERTGAPAPEAPVGVRMAIMLMRAGEVALVEDGDDLVLPSARGSGEELALEYLAELRGANAPPASELDLVGFATARRGGADLEVWLHESGESEREPDFVWIPLLELMERLGGPRLRSPGLVAAILMLVRSETGFRVLREAPAKRGPPRELAPEPRAADLGPGEGPQDFLDLELSILDFNQRVLELAEDRDVPLLERFQFLSIFSSNTDEFFVVRVGRIKEEVSRRRSENGEELSAEALLDLVAIRIRALVARQYAVLGKVLLPALAESGIRLLSWQELDEDQRGSLARQFEAEIFPLLTPLAMSSDPGRSFPRLVSLDVSLAVQLRRGGEGERPGLGYVPIPSSVPRFLPVPGSRDLIAVEQVVGANAEQLFPSATVEDFFSFRATRLGDVEIDEDHTGSLLSEVADQVEKRPYQPVIRLEVEDRTPREVRAFLLNAIRNDQVADGPTLTQSDLYEVRGPVDLTALATLRDLDVPNGTYPPHERERPLDPDRSIFDVLQDGDILCHHPFQDFDSMVGRFLREAAEDPDVVSIKLTLYRTGRRSPIVEALLKALEAGKEVAVFVELKARFDEESNIHWTHALRSAGARVVYGVVGYKTHAKTALVVRRENDAVRRYVHVGTGNYNASTARFYTDLGLMSADPDLGADLNDFFNEITGAAGPPEKRFRRLLVAPNSLVQELERGIDREIEHARAGRPARIQAKVNGLADRKLVKALYRAAGEGVAVDLVVRSICTLRPGVEGLSEAITVRSVLGRFLEHSRIVFFENAGQSEYYIGSADWRARNLRRRVEVMAPVDDAEGRAVLRAILDRQLSDPRAWVLRPDGAFERLRGEGIGSQEYFMTTGGRAE